MTTPLQGPQFTPRRTEYDTPTTRDNVCQRFGHDSRWRLVIGPMSEGVRRPAVQVCMDCGQMWR